MSTGQRKTRDLDAGHRSPDELGTVRGLINSWRLALRARNRAPRTLEAYTLAATQLADFLGMRGMPVEVAKIRREHVEAFIESVLETKAPATANQRYRSLAQFFR